MPPKSLQGGTAVESVSVRDLGLHGHQPALDASASRLLPRARRQHRCRGGLPRRTKRNALHSSWLPLCGCCCLPKDQCVSTLRTPAIARAMAVKTTASRMSASSGADVLNGDCQRSSSLTG